LVVEDAIVIVWLSVFDQYQNMIDSWQFSYTKKHITKTLMLYGFFNFPPTNEGSKVKI